MFAFTKKQTNKETKTKKTNMLHFDILFYQIIDPQKHQIKNLNMLK